MACPDDRHGCHSGGGRHRLIWERNGGDGCRSCSFHVSCGDIAIPDLCGAYIGFRGELVATDVSPEDYPPGLDIFPKGTYHLYDYMFFFTTLKQNVADQAAAFFAAADR